MTEADCLAAYLARIQLAHAPTPDAAGLATLQAAHRQTIAFENLDVRLRRPIRIDSDAVFAKLVQAGRGGYCFEQNRLFADMLAQLGLANRPLLARVRLAVPPGQTPPRTHVLLLVDLDGEPWVADAGFGGSYVPPLPLRDGATVYSADGAVHRLHHIGNRGDLGGEWLLERAGPPNATDGRAADHEDWQPQYSFDLAPVAPDDLEQANHWTSTRPETRFTTLHIVSIALPQGFATLTDCQLKIYRDDMLEERAIPHPAGYASALAEIFNLALDPADVAALPLFAR